MSTNAAGDGCTAERFGVVRSLTDVLSAPLSAEDQTVQSMPDASPTKWHRAHTTWFFEEFVLGRLRSGYQPFNPGFRYLFNSYYESVGPRHVRDQRGLLSRPGVIEITDYRAAVDRTMVEALSGRLDPETNELVTLGLNHEQQHQELLLMDIKHVLSMNPLRPAYRSGRAASCGPPAPFAWTERAGGVVEIGNEGLEFAFDNEMPRHRVHLEPFALATRTVTSAEWLAFIEDGGYRRPELWLSDGWAKVRSDDWSSPLYWRLDDEGWRIFTLTGERDLDPFEPVSHVSYYEAEAFARWAGARLPTEAEWEHAVGCQAMLRDRFYLDVLHPRSDAEGSLHGSVGQVWEWTASPYTPYPGFRPVDGAVGEYNGKFMVNQHVLRGGSCVTPPGHARPTYRNFFSPASRWPFTGVRLAKDR